MKNIEIGMTAPEIISAIVKNNSRISPVFFAVYVPARYLRPESITNRLLRHNPAKEIIEMERKEATTKNITRLMNRFNGEPELLAFASRVRLKGEDNFFHLPLIDFRCEPSNYALDQLTWFLEETRQQKGVILFSGNSYHYS